MTIGSLFGELIKSLFTKPVTIKYPVIRSPEPERMRGKLIWDPDKCSGCQLCVKDCPADALELIVLDKANKQFVMRYNADRCTFCDQCVISCRLNALQLSKADWELASISRDPLTIVYGKDEDVKTFLDRAARPDSDIPHNRA